LVQGRPPAASPGRVTFLSGVCLKISERNWLGSAGGIPPPHPPSARLALNRSGKDDFKFFFGGKFFQLLLSFIFWIKIHCPFNSVFVSKHSKIGTPRTVLNWHFYFPTRRKSFE